MLNWMKATPGEEYIYEINRGHFDTQPSATVLSRRFDSLLFDGETLHIVLGSDSGLLISYVQRNLSRAPKSRYLFIEPASVLERLNERCSYDPERIALGTLDDWATLCEKLKYNSYAYLNRIKIIQSLGAQADLEGIYAALRDELEAVNVRTSGRLLAFLGHKHFRELQLKNSPDYLHTVTEIAQRIRGRDVLVLGGGPSLDEHIDWIKQHRNQFMLLAITRIAGFLKQNGVKPDYYACVDPFPAMFNVSRDAIRQSREVPLISGHHTHEAVIANWCSRIYFSGDRLPWQSALNQPTYGAQGPTVTHFAIMCAVSARARRVFICGFDQCFSITDMRSHHAASGEAQVGPLLTEHTVPVATYSGAYAETTRHFLMSIESTEHLANQATESGVPLYNISSNAAKVPGIDYFDPERFRDSPLSLSSPETQSETESAIQDASAEVIEYLHALAAELRTTMEAMTQLRDDLQSRSTRINNLFTKQGLIRPEVSRLIQDIDREVEALGASKASFVREWAAGRLSNTVSLKIADEITPGDLQTYYAEYYDQHLVTLDEITAVLGEALQKCSRRLMEHHAPSLDALAEVWRDNEEYLRINNRTACHAVRGHPHFAATQATLEEGFEALCSSADKVEAGRLSLTVSPELLITRAETYLHRGRAAPVGALAQYAEKSSSTRFSAGTVSLLQGYYLEAQGEPESALKAYEAVINANESELLERALKRILRLSESSGDHENAIAAATCLEQLAPTYLRLHAELLVHLGDLNGAIEKYADYHDAFPQDYDVLARLAEIYLHLGHREHAETLVSRMAALQPEHPAVKRAMRLVQAPESPAR